jgi:hypothetical protein
MMVKRAFFTVFILALPLAILLLGGAGAPSVAAPDQAPLALQFPTNTPTPRPCRPEYSWALCMSDQPYPEGCCKDRFQEGISRVYAQFKVDVIGESEEVIIEVIDPTVPGGGIKFWHRGVYTGTHWADVEVPGWKGGVVPNGLYRTNLYRPDDDTYPAPYRQTEDWIVGVSVEFDKEYYYTTSDKAVITIIDLANRDPTEQETVQVQVTSDSDPTGFFMELVETSMDSNEFTFISPEEALGFSTTDSNPVAGVIHVANGDRVQAVYEGEFTAEAIWYEMAATPTPTTPPTSTPPPTVGPSPTPTPTLPPGGTAVTVTPAANAVGYVRSYDPHNDKPNHFSEADMYVGIWGGFNIHIGAVQFDLSSIPPGASIHQASMTLTGKSSTYVESEGIWKLQLLDSGVDAGWPNHTYANIYGATVLATIPPELGPDDLGVGWPNIFTFTEGQLTYLEERVATTGQVSFRVDGPDTGNRNIFVWYTGYGSGDEAKRPVLHVEFSLVPPTPTSTATPTPTATPTDTTTPTVTPTNTASPEVTLTPTATPTSTPTATVTPTPMLRAICVLVYEDLDGDGTRDLGERLLPDALITVKDDQGQDVPGSPYATDGINEPHCFTDLTPGTYTVREENPLGYISTTSDTWHVPVPPDIPVPVIEFGDQPPPTPTSTSTPTSTRTPTLTPTLTPTPTTGAVCVLAFEDQDGDGVRDPGEGLLAGAVITVTDGVGQVVGEPYTTDGVSEPHCFADLTPGLYNVSAQSPSEYILTTDELQSALVFANINVEVKFGARSASLPTFTPTLTATSTATPTVTLTPTPTATPRPIQLYLPLILSRNTQHAPRFHISRPPRLDFP